MIHDHDPHVVTVLEPPREMGRRRWIGIVLVCGFIYAPIVASQRHEWAAAATPALMWQRIVEAAWPALAAAPLMWLIEWIDAGVGVEVAVANRMLSVRRRGRFRDRTYNVPLGDVGPAYLSTFGRAKIRHRSGAVLVTFRSGVADAQRIVAALNRRLSSLRRAFD